jgi:drug/metabolite transporter (DMT)-like permease
VVIAAWIAACVIWSSVWLAIKIGVSGVPPFGFAALRLALALVVLLPLAWARHRRGAIAARELRLIAQTGALLLGANYALVYWGSQFISSGLTATLQALTPVFGIIVSRLMPAHERTTPAQFVALCCGVLGVAVVFWPDLVMSRLDAVYGAAAVIGGAFCVALAYVRVRHEARHLSTLTLMTGQLLAGLVCLLPLALLVEGNPMAATWTASTIAALLYLVIAGSLLAFWLNYWLLARMPVRQVLMMSVVEPLLAVALGAAVLGERMTPLTAVGGCMIVAATYFTLRGDPST